MAELKTIDPKEKSFTANGVEYFIEQSLSFDRYKMYQKLQIECGFDVSFYGMATSLNDLYDLQNQGKLADAAILTHNLRTGIANIDKRNIPVLEMCSLFVNTKDEDRTIINQDMVDKKIENWRVEGIAIDYFFTLAISTIQNYMKIYNEISQASSMKKIKKKSS